LLSPQELEELKGKGPKSHPLNAPRALGLPILPREKLGPKGKIGRR